VRAERVREKGRGTPLSLFPAISLSLSLPILHIPRASARPYGKMQLKELSAGEKKRACEADTRAERREFEITTNPGKVESRRGRRRKVAKKTKEGAGGA